MVIYISGSAMVPHCPNVMAPVGLHRWYKSSVKLVQKQCQTGTKAVSNELISVEQVQMFSS